MPAIIVAFLVIIGILGAMMFASERYFKAAMLLAFVGILSIFWLCFAFAHHEDVSEAIYTSEVYVSPSGSEIPVLIIWNDNTPKFVELDKKVDGNIQEGTEIKQTKKCKYSLGLDLGVCARYELVNEKENKSD